jgi:lipid-binding SYLF domain-containing protein
MTKLTVLLIFASQALLMGSDSDRARVVQRVRDAARVFEENRKAPNGMPERIIDQAVGIIIVPRLKRAGFVAGAEFGKGVFVARTAGGWTAPCMVRIDGGGLGLLAGVGETDLVLVAMDTETVRQLMHSGVKIGFDVMAAAGPVGRESEIDTTPIPTSGLFSYSHARGVFAGVALGGTTLRSDDDDNTQLYGRRVYESQVLSGQVDPTREAEPLLSILGGHLKKGQP